MPLPPLVAPATALTPDEITRYSRHLLIPGIEAVGQRRLKNARVLVLGAGGLGSPVLLYLAAAGIGTLGVLDDDLVDPTNLQRQVIHADDDVGRRKVDSARDQIARINPHVAVEVWPDRLTATNALDILGRYDVIVDGTDNFPTRYLVNDACAQLGLPCVWGAILRFDGQVAVFWANPPAGCGYPAVQYRDVFPEPPAPGTVPSCAEAGVLGALCGMVGSTMATEVVKLVTGTGEPLLGRLLVVDALAASWRELPVRPDPRRTPTAPLRAEPAASDRSWPGAAVGDSSTLPGSGTGTRDALPDLDARDVGPTARTGPDADLQPAERGMLTARELAARLAARELGDDEFDLVDVREPAEHHVVAIEGARLIPLGAFLDGSAVRLLDRRRTVIVHCKTGSRSAQAGALLTAAGFPDVLDLRGGVLAWIDDVDPRLPRY